MPGSAVNRGNMPQHLARAAAPSACISLIGMAGAGKSTLGRLLAHHLDWAFVDTDRLLEAYWGQPLQALYDNVGHSEFLHLESYQIRSLGLSRAVVATGGSVVYDPEAVNQLHLLGQIVFLRISLPTFLTRVGDAQGRALARPKGKTMEDLFTKRQPLYEAAADFTVDTDRFAPEECVRRILENLPAGFTGLPPVAGTPS